MALYRAAYPCDLHAHTTRSDGKDSPRELIDNAAAVGLKVLAVTDHDIIAPEAVEVDGVPVPLVEYGRQKGVAVLPGIEFSCDTQVEDVHIVALGCNWRHPFFEREFQASVQSKADGYRELCGLLARQGMPISWEEDILLGGRRRPDQVQRKQIFEAMADKGYAESWSKAKLLVKNTLSLRVRRRKPDPMAVIRGIHAAGGLAILAHPYLIEGVPRTAYIDRLADAGLDGIEASYPYDKTSYSGVLTPAQAEVEVRERYAGRLSIISGGSDYHAEERAGIPNPRRLGERGVHWDYFMSHPLLSALV